MPSYENEGGTCYALRRLPSGLQHVVFSADAPDEIRVAGKGEKAIWIELFLFAVSSRDYSEDEVREAAEAVRFNNLPEVIRYCSESVDPTYYGFVAALSEAP